MVPVVLVYIHRLYLTPAFITVTVESMDPMVAGINIRYLENSLNFKPRVPSWSYRVDTEATLHSAALGEALGDVF